MAQTSEFDPTLKVKTCFDCKMFDVTNWLAYLNGKDGPTGISSYETLSGSSQRALEIGHPPSPHLESWQNHVNMLQGADLHPKTTKSDSLQTPQTKIGALTWSRYLQKICGQTGKKATHECLRIEGDISGSEKCSRTSVKFKQRFLLQTTQQ